MRLIVIGDSNSYGTGMPDCALGNIAGNPSKLAWPNLVADMLKLDLVNLSIAGASNSYMLWTLRNTDLRSDDLVVVQWSWTGRDTIFNRELHIVRPNEHNHINDHYYQAHTLEDMRIRNLMTIEHAILWLENICKKWLMIAADQADPGLPSAQGQLISMSLYPPPDYLLQDFGTDNMHSGIRTQKYWAHSVHTLIMEQAWVRPDLKQWLPLTI